MCVYRDPINTAPQIAQSIYFSGRPETCSLTFEFDPAEMINEGEGWIYRTSTLSLVLEANRHFASSADSRRSGAPAVGPSRAACQARCGV